MRIHDNSDTENVQSDKASYCGPLGGPPDKKRSARESARFNIPPVTSSQLKSTSVTPRDDDDYVEITLGVLDDSITVHSVQAPGGAKGEDPQLAKKSLQKKSSYASSIFCTTSSRIKPVSQELKRFPSFSERPPARHFDRTKSAVTHALKGLKFITTKASGGATGWPVVEKRFDELTASTNGLLHFSLFCECIGSWTDCNIFWFWFGCPAVYLANYHSKVYCTYRDGQGFQGFRRCAVPCTCPEA